MTEPLNHFYPDWDPFDSSVPISPEEAIRMLIRFKAEQMDESKPGAAYESHPVAIDVVVAALRGIGQEQMADLLDDLANDGWYYS